MWESGEDVKDELKEIKDNQAELGRKLDAVLAALPEVPAARGLKTRRW